MESSSAMPRLKQMNSPAMILLRWPTLARPKAAHRTATHNTGVETARYCRLSATDSSLHMTMAAWNTDMIARSTDHRLIVFN